MLRENIIRFRHSATDVKANQTSQHASDVNYENETSQHASATHDSSLFDLTFQSQKYDIFPLFIEVQNTFLIFFLDNPRNMVRGKVLTFDSFTFLFLFLLESQSSLNDR